MARRKKKVTVRKTGLMDLPDPMPKFEVYTITHGPLLVEIRVTNLDSNQTAVTTCGPDSDHNIIIQELKERLYHA